MIIFGTPTESVDWIIGDDDNDLISGLGGDDFIVGNGGADRLLGNDGDDAFVPGLGKDQIWGGFQTHDSGNDTVNYSGYAAAVLVDLAASFGYQQSLGNDDRDMLHGIENAVGSAYDDTLRGDDTANVLGGRGGDDGLWGRAGNDQLYGGGGNDSLHGDAGHDLVEGGDGNDAVLGDAGADSLYGDAGDDFLSGGDGNDELYGGAGSDGLFGGAGKDFLHGGRGNDQLAGGGGADVIDGGAGDDLLFYSSSPSRVVVSLAGGSGSQGDATGDTIANVEGVVGSVFNDVLTGDAYANRLFGGGGGDRLSGGGGDDQLFGQSGADRLTGGLGADWFRMLDMDETDIITDFNHAEEDKIHLTDLDADETLAGNQDFTFIGNDGFSNTAGELRYRHNGADTVIQGDINGDGAADFSVTLTGSHSLTADDFIL